MSRSGANSFVAAGVSPFIELTDKDDASTWLVNVEYIMLVYQDEDEDTTIAFVGDDDSLVVAETVAEVRQAIKVVYERAGSALLLAGG